MKQISPDSTVREITARWHQVSILCWFTQKAPAAELADQCTPNLVAKEATSLLGSLQRPLFLFRVCHRFHQWKDIDSNVFSFGVTAHILSLSLGKKTTSDEEKHFT